MDETSYSVSEAVRLVGVESHVLRYWEEELRIPIRRTSQGHRIYSQKDIEVFCQVREWKQKGLQLKAIRVLLDKSDGAGESKAFDEQIWTVAYSDLKHASEIGDGGEETTNSAEAVHSGAAACSEAIEDEEAVYEIVPVQESKGDLEKVVLILKQMIEEVVAEQNKKLEREITEQLRSELEALYLQYVQALQEASAAREQEKTGILRQMIRKLFPGRK